MSICYTPIGVIHSPFTQEEGMPIQPTGAAGTRGSVVIEPKFQEGLADLEGFSHVILVYHFHKVTKRSLTVVPFMDTEPRGVLATRAPIRPNPIGISVVRLVSVRANVLEIENIDVLDGTPLLDIKPYIPDADANEVESTGWIESARRGFGEARADDRFS